MIQLLEAWDRKHGLGQGVDSNGLGAMHDKVAVVR